MAQRVVAEGFQLVSGPVPIVERACAAKFEWVAASGDMLQVKLGAALDQGGDRGRLEVTQ